MESVTTGIDPRLTERPDHFVGGTWVPAQGSVQLDVIDPSTEELVARVPEATADEVDAAVAAARRAFDEGPWPWTAPKERAAVLDRIADGIERRLDDLVALGVAECGWPVAQGPPRQQHPATVYRYYAEQARTYGFREDRTRTETGEAPTRVVQEPAGVVAAITTWNGPGSTAALKLGPALAAGCTAIVKPPPETPLSSYVLAEVLAEAGLPEGVVSILPAGREVGAHLSGHPGVDKVAFTGSSAAGKQVMAACADRVARVTLELGGKSAAIVCDDADLERHAASIVMGGCRSSGQGCWAQTRALVSSRRKAELVEAMVEIMRGLKVGSAHDPDTLLGPLAMRRQYDRVAGYVQIGREEGATVLTGGGRPADAPDRGFYFEPTLLLADNSMRVAQEEIFGPVICVIEYGDTDEAVRIANDTIYGLSGTVYTGDPEAGYAIARRVRTGTVTVNGSILDFSVPFGGFKQSGVGREGGPDAMANYLETKSIHMPPDA